MGSARLQGKKLEQGQGQQKPDTSQGLDNSTGNGTVTSRMLINSKNKRERQAQEQAAAAALSEAEKAAAQKTAELANSAGGGVSTNGQGSSSYTEGNTGQDDSQAQGDVALSTSDTTRRRGGGYRRDAGISI